MRVERLGGGTFGNALEHEMGVVFFGGQGYVSRFQIGQVPEDTPADVIRVILPDFWVKGSDYGNYEELPEYRALLESGGKVKLIPLVEGFSTTDIYKKIQGQANK